MLDPCDMCHLYNIQMLKFDKGVLLLDFWDDDSDWGRSVGEDI